MSDELFARLFGLTGRVAIVTGASSGIGRRLATTLAAAGATVYAVARREDRLAELASTNPHRIHSLPADLSDENECRRVVEDVVATSGQVDVLVNNAGVSKVMRAEDDTVDSFRSVVGLNLVTPYALSIAAGRQMLIQDDGGSIVNIASIVGLVGLGRMPQASYAASKAGLVNLTRELAAQWARRGVRVNAIAPGWFPTEMTGELFDNEAGERWVARLTPMGRHGTVEELDAVMLFLAGRGSSYVTGAVIPVDGGWTAV